MSQNLPTIIFNAEIRTLQFKLYEADGTTPLDLTGLTVTLAIGGSATTPSFSGALTLTDAAEGEGEIELDATEIAAIGTGRQRYSLRETAPGNRVLQYGHVTFDRTF